MNNILEIAAKHLGKKESYKYSEVTPRLLVPIPREKARALHNVKGTWDRGADIWNCFEFSTFLNGAPYFGLVTFRVDSSSPNIVESKSLKLYLNSWNNVNVQFDSEELAFKHVIRRLKDDIEIVVGMPLHGLDWYIPENEVEGIDFVYTDRSYYQRTFDDLVYDTCTRNTMKTELSKLTFYGFMSNCLVTNQPDWGILNVMYNNVTSDYDKKVLYTEIMRLIIPFRHQNHFHEQACEVLYDKILDKFKLDWLRISISYTRRGGISITPVRQSKEYDAVSCIQNYNETVLFQ